MLLTCLLLEAFLYKSLLSKAVLCRKISDWSWELSSCMGCEGWICSASVNQKTPVLPLVLHPHTKLLRRTALHMVFKTHMEKAEIFVRNLQDLQILVKIPFENNKLAYSGNYLFHYICQYIPLHHR